MKQKTCREWRIVRRRVETWVLLTGLTLIPLSVAAQDPIQPVIETVREETPAPPATDEIASTAIDTEKKQKAIAGLAAVGAILILGVSAIAATLMWARRLRRFARDFGPPQKTVGNDFWFLKPPKPVANEPEISNTHRPPLGEKRDEH